MLAKPRHPPKSTDIHGHPLRLAASGCRIANLEDGATAFFCQPPESTDSQLGPAPPQKPKNWPQVKQYAECIWQVPNLRMIGRSCDSRSRLIFIWRESLRDCPIEARKWLFEPCIYGRSHLKTSVKLRKLISSRSHKSMRPKDLQFPIGTMKNSATASLRTRVGWSDTVSSGVVTLSSNLTQNGNTTTVTSGTLDLGAASMRAQRRCASGAKDLRVTWPY